MDKVLNAVIRLRRDTEANYASIAESFIPQNGEICLVETSKGIRTKVGDGVKSFYSLDYISYNKDIVFTGYYLNDKFYSDSTYTVELPKLENTIYIDKNDNSLYTWNGSAFNRDVQKATESLAGLVKLYSGLGNNTDGTMTQKSIKDSFESVKFAINEEDTECLVLSIPQ